MLHRLKNVKQSTWLKFGVFLAFMFMLLFFVPYSTLYKWFTIRQAVEWVSQARTSPFTVTLFYFCYVVGILFLPITLFPIIGGVLCDFWIALPINLAAAAIGSWFAFTIARFFGRGAIESLLKGRLKSFDELAAQQGFKTVFFVRWTGIPPFIIANYALGLSGISSRDYVLGTVLGIAPWMAVVTYAANSLWRAVLLGGETGLAHALFETLGPLMILSVLTLITVLVTYWIKRRRAAVEVRTDA